MDYQMITFVEIAYADMERNLAPYRTHFPPGENMKCRDCGIDMVEGVVMVPIYGSANGNLDRGVTVSAVSSVLGKCMKCPKCGHSVGGRMLETREGLISM